MELVMQQIKRSCHFPSFLWGAGMVAAIYGIVQGQWTIATAGLLVYFVGWALLRWQPTYDGTRGQ